MDRALTSLDVEATRSLISGYINAESSSITSQSTNFDLLISKINESNDQLGAVQDIIELMEPFLVSVVDSDRNKATLLLAEIFRTKVDLPLNGTVIHLYIVFFSQRLTDYPSIIPSLLALIALVHHHGSKLEGKYQDGAEIFSVLSSSISIPSYAQNIRQIALNLFDELFSCSNIVASLQGNATEIIESFLSAVSGEKDPRCLLSVLKVATKAIHCFPQEFPTTYTEMLLDYENDAFGAAKERLFFNAELGEKIFEGLACYFPITFVPPPDDPFGITADALSSALCSCLCKT